MGRIYKVSLFHKCKRRRGKYIRQSLDKGYVEIVLNLRNPLAQVILEKVLQLARKFDTGGTTANNNHVQKTLDLVLGLVLEGSRLDAVHDTLANLLRVADLLQEAGILANTGDAYLISAIHSFFRKGREETHQMSRSRHQHPQPACQTARRCARHRP
jgi:hypothetical protein